MNPHTFHTLWFGYFYPSIKGNGPEAIVQTIVYFLIAVAFVPLVRKAIKREAKKLHGKLDHIIKFHPDIPDYPEGEHNT